MKVYAGLDPRLPLRDVADYARRIEAIGFDGIHVAETIHDSLAVALLVAEHTERITIRTAITLAFVRSPTLVAYTAWGLSSASGGRFELGLGSQIRQNIEGRYGMPWTEPVARMRDYIGAVRALFDAFRTGADVRYESDSYRITRLQPYFNPGPDDATATPPIWLGGVNVKMCRLAGEAADGLVTHPTNSDPRFLREVVVPNTTVPIVAAVTLAVGESDDVVAAERERQRRLLAFLYSTPAYAPTLELHGRGDVAERLRAMIRNDSWDDLPNVVDDDLLDALVVSGRYEQVGAALRDRYRGLVAGVAMPSQPDPGNDEHLARLVAHLHEED
jgi:probable F420-dependent oxidoreductase